MLSQLHMGFARPGMWCCWLPQTLLRTWTHLHTRTPRSTGSRLSSSHCHCESLPAHQTGWAQPSRCERAAWQCQAPRPSCWQHVSTPACVHMLSASWRSLSMTRSAALLVGTAAWRSAVLCCVTCGWLCTLDLPSRARRGLVQDRAWWCFYCSCRCSSTVR